VFATRTLDERNWCFDFGGLKPIRAWLHEMFDHTLIVAADDPEIAQLRELGHHGLASVRVLPAVGCEAVAKFVHDYVSAYVHKESGGRVWLESVEVREHGGNSAIYES
jgi:6-pyruvoyltetrahydropterin/6-carboxytetrahydropterin synthase